jgi:DNA-cytosine methyltransferase
MTHGSLFSGIGGFDLAAEWMGWQNVFHCEWNTFGQRVLKHYWPNAISYHDITKTDFTIHRGRIDILTGGFPCQPYSSAGKRLGKEDDRHLWPEMLRAIRQIQPRWVVGENVLGLVNWSDGLVFHEVQVDLEAEGYKVQPFVLPAVSVNAPHRRDRVWFVAHAKDNGYGRRDKFRQDIGVQKRSVHKCKGEGWDEVRAKSERPIEEWSSTNTNGGATGTPGASGSIENDWGADDIQSSEWGSKAEQHNRPSTISRDAADTKCSRLEHWNKTRNLPSEEGKTRRQRSKSTNEFEANGNGEFNAADTDCNGCNERNCKHEKQSSEGRVDALSNTYESNDNGDASDTTGEQGEWGRPKFRESCEPEQGQFRGNGSEVGSKRDVADTNGIGLRGESNGIGNSRFFGQNDKASDWETFPSVSPICDGNDGISDRLDGITFPKWRKESIKAGGNAVVPQVVFQIFRTIEEYEKTHAQ